MKRLEKNVTIITGGGKGIGFGIAQAFAAEGSDLVLTGRTESRLIAAKEKLEKELAFYKAEIERGERMLSNQGFVAKAPAALIENEKNKLAKNKEMYNKILEELNA